MRPFHHEISDHHKTDHMLAWTMLRTSGRLFKGDRQQTGWYQYSVNKTYMFTLYVKCQKTTCQYARWPPNVDLHATYSYKQDCRDTCCTAITNTQLPNPISRSVELISRGAYLLSCICICCHWHSQHQQQHKLWLLVATCYTNIATAVCQRCSPFACKSKAIRRIAAQYNLSGWIISTWTRWHETLSSCPITVKQSAHATCSFQLVQREAIPFLPLYIVCLCLLNFLESLTLETFTGTFSSHNWLRCLDGSQLRQSTKGCNLFHMVTDLVQNLQCKYLNQLCREDESRGRTEESQKWCIPTCCSKRRYMHLKPHLCWEPPSPRLQSRS